MQFKLQKSATDLSSQAVHTFLWYLWWYSEGDFLVLCSKIKFNLKRVLFGRGINRLLWQSNVLVCMRVHNWTNVIVLSSKWLDNHRISNRNSRQFVRSGPLLILNWSIVRHLFLCLQAHQLTLKFKIKKLQNVITEEVL